MQSYTITKIIKTGSSLCVVLPKNYLTALTLQRGDQVVLAIGDYDTLIIRRMPETGLLPIKVIKM
ncbi:MAG: hypothetical protein AAB706_00700 [Patescibacteria group bacterium]